MDGEVEVDGCCQVASKCVSHARDGRGGGGGGGGGVKSGSDAVPAGNFPFGGAPG